MKISVLLAIGTTIAAAALFAACGGDDSTNNGPDGGSSTSKITTQHGLAVAALVADFQQNSNSSGADAAALPASEGSSQDSSVASSNSGRIPGDSSINSAPAAGDGTTGITVQGYGLASADADSAILMLYFSSYNYGYPVPIDAPGASSGNSSGSEPVKPDVATPGIVSPITRADLQPVIDALISEGVADADIQLVGQNSYYDAYSANATLQANVKDVSKVNSALTAARNAGANLGAITLQSSNVSYTLEDCSALEQAAMDAAVSDAGERGALLAGALHVGLGDVTGASDYSYSPSGVPCTSNYYGYPIYYDTFDSVRANGDSSNTVQVVAQISVTYAMN